MEKSDSQ